MNEEDKLLEGPEIETNRVDHFDTILFNRKLFSFSLLLHNHKTLPAPPACFRKLKTRD